PGGAQQRDQARRTCLRPDRRTDHQIAGHHLHHAAGPRGHPHPGDAAGRDILDNMEETAHRFAAFRVEKPTPAAESMARIVHDCCNHLVEALRLCRDMKDIEGIQTRLREISRLENEADRINRESDSALFANPPDILLLIKWRELYGWLEETVDACKT